jgi:hypothetical protein
MRVAQIITFLVLLYTANVHADISIRYDVIAHNQHLPYHSVLIKRDLVRIDQDKEVTQSLLINLQSGDIVQLHNPSQHYFSINVQTIDQYINIYKQNRSLLQGVIDQGLTQLDAQQREQLELFIDAYKKPAQGDQFDIRVSKQRRQVLGVDCNVLAIFQRNLLKSEICLSDYRQLGLNAADTKSLQQLKSFLHQFKNSAPKPYQALFDLLSQGKPQIDGLPMQMVNYRADGKVSYIIQAGAISLRLIPEWKYRIPPAYQPSNFPVM